MIFLNELNSETDIDNLKQIDSAANSLVSFGSEPMAAIMKVDYYSTSAR